MESRLTDTESPIKTGGPRADQQAESEATYKTTLTDKQLSEDCALPGGYNSGADSVGWAEILTSLASAVSGPGIDC